MDLDVKGFIKYLTKANVSMYVYLSQFDDKLMTLVEKMKETIEFVVVITSMKEISNAYTSKSVMNMFINKWRSFAR